MNQGQVVGLTTESIILIILGIMLFIAFMVIAFSMISISGSLKSIEKSLIIINAKTFDEEKDYYSNLNTVLVYVENKYAKYKDYKFIIKGDELKFTTYGGEIKLLDKNQLVKQVSEINAIIKAKLEK